MVLSFLQLTGETLRDVFDGLGVGKSEGTTVLKRRYPHGLGNQEDFMEEVRLEGWIWEGGGTGKHGYPSQINNLFKTFSSDLIDPRSLVFYNFSFAFFSWDLQTTNMLSQRLNYKCKQRVKSKGDCLGSV